MAWRTIGLAVALALPSVAAAQAPPAAKPPVVPHVERGNANPCDTRATIGQGGGIDIQKPDNKTLSDKLAQSHGVICPPPHVDPNMKQPTPPGGITPVIPPEAVTPNAQPK
jgi:hypothetical protein